MPLGTILLLLALAGLLVAVAGLVALRASGARAAVARRLAGPPELKVGDLYDADPLPERPVRVSGRIRCRDPLDAGDGERLVAYHRDVEVRVGGRWRNVERLRETRSFELWDHAGSVTVDPSLAAEPLITIPTVWRGSVEELRGAHAGAAARLAERHGPASEARAVIRSVNVTDRLLVLARPVREDGSLRLEAPAGGFLLTNLALPDAMRLLGGRHRRLAVAGIVGLGLGGALAVIGLVGALLAVALGA
ncbi:MAG TPA: hypothetical protein VHQ42_08735 [Candidatus Limnocylindria bacterium]|nr:hypothetical protein [Candidatus Limnocylindria bacterium]